MHPNEMIWHEENEGTTKDTSSMLHSEMLHSEES